MQEDSAIICPTSTLSAHVHGHLINLVIKFDQVSALVGQVWMCGFSQTQRSLKV